MKDADIQIGLINVMIGGALLWLFVMQRGLGNVENLLFWLASGTFIVHWYWGLIAFVKHLGPTEDLAEFFLDIAAVGMAISTMLWINLPWFWFTLNGVSFLLAVIKYLVFLKGHPLTGNRLTYVKEKIMIDSVAVIGMLFGVIAALYFRPIWLLGAVTLITHLIAIAVLSARRQYVLKED